MEEFAVGDVVLVKFPFSNLKGQKVRPALILATVEFENLILCQITSKPYSSQTSVKIVSNDFSDGELPVVSYIRPDKLFTAEKTIISGKVGRLNTKMRNKVFDRVREIFV